MRKGATALVLVLAGLWTTSAALANAPERSLRPSARAVTSQLILPRETTVPVYYNASIRPIPRPSAGLTGSSESAQYIVRAASLPMIAVRIASSVPGVARSLRPVARPRDIAVLARNQSQSPVRVASSEPAETAPRRETRRDRRQRTRQTRQGSVCGDRSIRGQEISSIRGRLRGCGVSSPVRITEIDGVSLTQPATINCETARALKTWINNGVRPAVGRLGGGVSSLRVIAHYSCRTRNNQPGARVSEHGRGKAVDIAAINLNNGSSLTVLTGWRDRTQRRVLRRIHSSACGPFGTVLGPDADRHHRDHFHLDTARHRGGSYCR
ncbi:extensin family protein [Pseudohalocynthiibacter aestuariivivens]|jgi:hypothetical protein|uniref:Extensin family protein n=1 Tax=Pseudohalocynthiibacter aestuariivivens TaxID=1591409 RepID=A0ABV5JCU7_9RHOB|nr:MULTISPECIES: extensin family protein [Pseudohalocynthiibacter]MBS9717223.1 extensin family protein [Pseudohalocynthiibacter aestuariivivens]MCK0103673.1 extensin family protein [Pseudohalocynthiibacter sp. F2068]